MQDYMVDELFLRYTNYILKLCYKLSQDLKCVPSFTSVQILQMISIHNILL